MVKRVNFIYNNDGLFILQVHVPSGSIYEHDTKKKIKGVSHFLEHILFKHTENFTGKELLKSFTKLGGNYNASTDKDETVFYVQTLAENYELATNLIYDIVKKPVFHDNEITQERKVTLEELASSKDDLEDAIYEHGNESFLCPSNVYASPVIGNKTHLQAMSNRDLSTYFKQRYRNFVVLVNCDNRHKNDVKRFIIAKFGQSKNVNLNEKDIAIHTKCIHTTPIERIRIIVSETYQFNTQLVFEGFRHAKQVENICMKFVKYCLTGAGLYSLLYNELREKRGLVYNVTVSCESFRYLGLVKISFGTSNKDTVAILKVIKELMQTLAQTGFDEEQLKFYKESFINSMKYRFIDQESRAKWHGENLFYGCNISESEYLKHIMSITNNSIKSICANVFNFKRMGFMTMGPYDEPKQIKNNILLLMV